MSELDYKYYFGICDQIATQSKCLSRKIGSLLLSPDKTILGTGFNGPPRGVSHCDSPERLDWLVENLKKHKSGAIRDYLLEHKYGEICPRQIIGFKSGEGLWVCPAAHSERNTLINSAREGVRTKGCTLIMNCPLPCAECSKEIINSGVIRIICTSGPDYDTGSRWLLEQAKIEITQINLGEI